MVALAHSKKTTEAHYSVLDLPGTLTLRHRGNDDQSFWPDFLGAEGCRDAALLVSRLLRVPTSCNGRLASLLLSLNLYRFAEFARPAIHNNEVPASIVFVCLGHLLDRSDRVDDRSTHRVSHKGRQRLGRGLAVGVG